MDQEINLKNCPFCGGNAKIVEEYDCMPGVYFYFVECSNCTATFLHGELEKSDVIKKWNKMVYAND